jgi:hypothetical protein
MKKFVLSMGLAAAGSAALQMTGEAQLSSTDAPKWWNVSASLNGFYDDNYSTSPYKHGSAGFEVSPTASLNLPLAQTDFGLTYTYDMVYYQERENLGQNPIDQTHSVGLWLDHSFNERWSVKLNESFVSGQEPELLVGGGTPYRLSGDNIANHATVEVDTELTREFSTATTFNSSYYDYNNTTNASLGFVGYAAELNRVDDSLALDFQWHLAPETIALIGYSFDIVNYTTDKYIGSSFYGNYYSDYRDNYTHTAYLGLQHNLLPNLVMAGKVGGQYNDAYNNPYYDTTAISPYANISLIYTYMVGCNAQLGFTQSRNATDIATISQSNGSVTQDQESSSIHLSVNHRITPKLYVSAIGTFAAGTFNGGTYNNATDDQFGLGLGANYAFTKNISGNINYNYDNLSSSIDYRGFERNRISVGVSIAY